MQSLYYTSNFINFYLLVIVAFPHPLSCCIYIALIPCLAAYSYTALVSLLFGTVIPTSFNILMEMFYSLVAHKMAVIRISGMGETHFMRGCGYARSTHEISEGCGTTKPVSPVTELEALAHWRPRLLQYLGLPTWTVNRSGSRELGKNTLDLVLKHSRWWLHVARLAKTLTLGFVVLRLKLGLKSQVYMRVVQHRSVSMRLKADNSDVVMQSFKCRRRDHTSCYMLHYRP